MRAAAVGTRHSGVRVWLCDVGPGSVLKAEEGCKSAEVVVSGEWQVEATKCVTVRWGRRGEAR